jgi:hypothetical protein
MLDPERTAVDPSCGPLLDQSLQFELKGDEIEPDGELPARRPLRRRRLVSVTGAAARRATRTAEPLASAAPWPVPATATDAWAQHLNRLLSLEIRVATTNGMLTAAEAEQLLARLVIVIDQAISPPEP